MTALGPDCCCLDDVAAAAEAVLPREVWDFLAGGAGDESTLRANRAALDRRHLVPRVLRDVSQCSTSTTLLGRPASMPLAVAPVALHRLFHDEGELATARAAKAHGVPFTVSTMSSVALDRIVAVGGAVWFQLYWLQDREQTFDLVQHAQDVGCEALMLTVDTPWMGRRRRDLRNGFALPEGVHAVELGLGAESSAHRSASGRSALAAHSAQAFSRSLTWTDLEALRSRCRLPLIVKGVLDPEDAARAVQHGADAVVVSNHGGRQLEGAVPAIDVLEEVCRAVDGRAEVLVDGAVRSGPDILRALALGADGVLVGRPLIWGLAADGVDGASRVLELLAAELRDALGLAGCAAPRAARALRTVLGAPAPAAGLSGT